MRNDLVAVGGTSAVFRMFELVSQLVIPAATGSFATYRSSFNHDASLVAHGFSGSPYIKVVNPRTLAAETLTGGNPAGAAEGVAFSADGSLLAVAHATSPFLTVYDTSDWSKVTITGGNPPGTGTAVAFSADGSLLAVGSNTSDYLTVYDTSDWSKVTITGGQPSAVVQGVAFSPDGTWLATCSQVNPTMTVYDTSDWSKETISGVTLFQGYDVQFTPDSAYLALGSSASPYITVFDTSDWSKETLTGTGPSSSVNSVSFTPDGTHLLCGTAGTERLVLYDTSTWTVVAGGLSSVKNGALSGTSGATYFDIAPTAPRFIRGTVLDEDGLPVARTVNVYRRSDNVFVGSTESDAGDGAYELELVDGDVEYDVQFVAQTGDPLNDLFYARVASGAS